MLNSVKQNAYLISSMLLNKLFRGIQALIDWHKLVVKITLTKSNRPRNIAAYLCSILT